ncbi:MAG: hypothetical protein JNM66_29180 [Bryobacterales bacterium]|nr:hypothetical protein [Bryobacterales bacterium]
MERTRDNTLNQPALSAIEQVRLLDEQLLRAVAGQESEVASWLDARHRAIENLVRDTPQISLLEELQDRTRRLEDRFLHWRRSAIMELSLIDQHLRFVNEQQPGEAASVSTRFDFCA